MILRRLFYFICASFIFFTLPVQADAPILESQVPSLAPMLNKVMPSVVNLQVIYPVQPVAGRRQDTPVIIPEQKTMVGSGVIIDSKKGYIITNNHVVTGAQEVIVTLTDGRTFRAKPVGGDPESDIAVIQIEATNLQAIELGDSEILQVGDFVVAIGNPFGLEHSVTSGIISGLGRTNLGIDNYENFIQTDASINPGNSGGALVDLRGKLIGINAAILSPSASSGNIGIGLAIPINMAHSIMLQLIQFGEVQRGLLGILAQSLTPELATALKRPNTNGAVISYVANDSLAQQVGLRVGDIVIKIDNKDVKDLTQMRNTIALIPISNKVSMTVIRNQEQKTFNFTMNAPETITTQWEQISSLLQGMELGRFDQDLPGHGHVQGLQVFAIAPDSPAARAQLLQGDIIVNVNQQPITDTLSLKQAVEQSEANKPLLLRVLRGKGAFFTVLR